MRRPRGVAQSTELILLLAGVIVLALVGAYAYGKSVMAHSTSEKATASLADAKVWVYLEKSGSYYYAKRVVAQVYVTNLGSKPIKIESVSVQFVPNAWAANWREVAMTIPDQYATVNPGETRVIAANATTDFRYSYVTYSGAINYYYKQAVVVSVTYSLVTDTTEGRELTLSKPVTAELIING